MDVPRYRRRRRKGRERVDGNEVSEEEGNMDGKAGKGNVIGGWTRQRVRINKCTCIKYDEHIDCTVVYGCMVVRHRVFVTT